MALQPYLNRQLVFIWPDITSRPDLFKRFAATVSALRPELDEARLIDGLCGREKQMPTCSPEGVAFPHALLADLHRTILSVASVPGGVDFGVPNCPPSDLVFCMFGCINDPWEHIRVLARVARVVRSEEARTSLRAAKDPDDLYSRLVAEDKSHA